MKKSEFIKDVAKEVESFVLASDEMSPIEFVTKLVEIFEKRDILNPTYMYKDGDRVIQLTGWEKEDEDTNE